MILGLAALAGAVGLFSGTPAQAAPKAKLAKQQQFLALLNRTSVGQSATATSGTITALNHHNDDRNRGNSRASRITRMLLNDLRFIVRVERSSIVRLNRLLRFGLVDMGTYAVARANIVAFYNQQYNAIASLLGRPAGTPFR